MSEPPARLPAPTIRELRADDHPALLALWEADPGLVLRAEDRSPAAFAAFLARNAGLCLAACEADRILGATLVGWDGRRGYVYHFVVAPAARRRGIGRALAAALVRRMQVAGIPRAHLLVVRDNAAAHGFWSALGWGRREDRDLYTLPIPPAGA